MTKFLTTTALALSLTLGGCATPGGIPSTINVASIIAAVQTGCKFTPLASVVLDLIAAGVGNIVEAICAVANQASRTSLIARRAAPGAIITIGKVGKVPIRGSFDVR